MNRNRAAVARAPLSVSSVKAASGEISFSKHSTPRKPAALSSHRHSTGMVKGNLQPATKLAKRDRIVLEHLPMVKGIAVRVHGNLPECLLRESALPPFPGIPEAERVTLGYDSVVAYQLLFSAN